MLIIIQGPYINKTKNLVLDLAGLFPYYKIKLSCYQEEINEELFNSYNNIQIIRNKDPGTVLIPPRLKPLNLKRQAKTTLSACKDSNEKWVLKIRSDLEIDNKDKFIRAFKKLNSFLNSENPPKIITLNTGSLDIFSYYDMIFHFNDWFFICERKNLIINCNAINNINESILIEPFLSSYPKNYYHSKKYRLIFHNEQLIHFGDKFLNKKTLKYGCQTNKFNIYRHIIWVAKYLKVVSLREIGIKSSKVGYPKFKSELVGISFKSHALHKLLVSSKGLLRILIMNILIMHGNLRKYLFLLLSNKNKLKVNLLKIKNKLLKKFKKLN